MHYSHRRSIRFATFADLRQDVSRLTERPAMMMGNWSLSQVINHLAAAFLFSLHPLPRQIRPPKESPWLAIRRRRLLRRTLPARTSIPQCLESVLTPQDGPMEQAVTKLEQAIDQLQRAQSFGCHPSLGRLGVDQYRQYHLRHAELHLSFAVVAEEPVV